MAQYAEPRERLVADVKMLLADTEEFLAVLGAESREKLAGIRPRLEAGMQRARVRLGEIEDAVELRTRESAQKVDAYARAHPWETAGMAAAVGAAVGAVVAALLNRH